MTPDIGKSVRSTQELTRPRTKPKSLPQRKDTSPQKKEKPLWQEQRQNIDGIEWNLAAALIAGAILVIALLPNPKPPQEQPNLADNLQQFKMRVLDEMQNGGCAGINKFITFTNFSKDLRVMESQYLTAYSPELGNPMGNATHLFPPAALSMGFNGIDCEDLVLWASCLANYYQNVSCDMYYELFDNGEQHVGLKCEETIGNYTYYTQI